MDIRLEPWSAAHLELLERINTPLMRRHVGGPETPGQLLRRHRRYLELPSRGGMMFAVLADRRPAGSIAFHRRDWQGAQVLETGWNVLPEFQGRGLAAAAGRAMIALLRAEAAADPSVPAVLHAFPAVDNTPSNALCARLGFTNAGPCAFEYPRRSGRFLRSNDWRLALR
ncbi:GNAT family N-acetyltransferase [Streptomyces sp. TLI_171]|uniref:GNAT family N-acetyltransferase n=1 Tax=Streptomyces sp. TLI_171 TaxID=1938859 RepID=UPI000C175AA0|nr:GNAT family N-acetyltransferase [Streptomyces sp. TLI_171]RKE21441.1 RimJ/RimL family protein N-acetyltransferase [Streptomyces sp. TLI_171]